MAEEVKGDERSGEECPECFQSGESEFRHLRDCSRLVSPESQFPLMDDRLLLELLSDALSGEPSGGAAHDELASRLRTLRAEVETLRADRERLDYAGEHVSCMAYEDNGGQDGDFSYWFEAQGHSDTFSGKTLREAIDAARAQEAGE